MFSDTTFLPQCLPPPRYTSGYWVNFVLELPLQQTGIPFKGVGVGVGREEKDALLIDATEAATRCDNLDHLT